MVGGLFPYLLLVLPPGIEKYEVDLARLCFGWLIE